MLPVVMTVLNNEKDIGKCLESLKEQTVDVKLYVVDAGSTDRTVEIIKKYKKVLPIDMTVKKVNRSVARDLAIRKTKGKFVGVVNSDVELEEDCFEELLEVIKKKKDAGGVAGTQTRPEGQNWVAKGIYYLPGMAQVNERQDFEEGLVETHSIPCECGIFRRKAFEEIDGFDESLNWGEDAELGMRLRQKGWKLYGVEKARFEHFYKSTLQGFWKQQVGYGTGGGIMWRKGMELNFFGLRWKKWLALISPVLIALYLFLLVVHPFHWSILTVLGLLTVVIISKFRLTTSLLFVVKVAANIYGVWKGIFQESQGVQG